MQQNDGQWLYSPDHGQLCQVIEAQTLWGETTCRVWLPGRDSVVRIAASRLKPIESAGTSSADNIAYIAAAARVADALTQDVLLAPIESSVIPLPHQIRALSRAIANDRVRYLLADEVGLGKTIEAGLILRELKLRGLVKRTLVIAPKGLVSQWVAEMRTHFNEHFQLVLPDDIKTLSRISAVPISEFEGLKFGGGHLGTLNLKPETLNPWIMFSQVVVPMDSVKPLDNRRGWTAAQVSEYNRERFEDLISAGWDLVIVDEAHRLGGSTDQVARFKLGQGLAEAAPYFLLLSATPHQGKTDAFHRLVSLIEAREFPSARHLTLEEPKVRGLAMRLPRFVPGQPIPVVSIPGIAGEVQGMWSLWRIAIAAMEWSRRRIMPLFLADNGAVYMPTARHVWDQLLSVIPQIRSFLETSASQSAFEKLQSAAEEHGRPIYEALVQEQRARIAREREKANYAFAARRRNTERIGLPQVRNYRLNLLAQEERTLQEQLDRKAHAYPELVPLLVIRVEGNRE
jgi:hypothetical protein